MKRVHRIGLVTAGKITGLWIEKTLELKRQVGPVYSTSLRLASRASNTLLRTGFHTTDWEELRHCEAVLFFLPRTSLRGMTAEWIAQGYDLRGLRLVVCDDELSLEDLEELRELGAQTAAIGPLPNQESLRFIGEGDPQALSPVTRLLEADGFKFTRLNAGGKQQLTAAVGRLETESLPMFALTVEALRGTGLTHDVSVALAEKCFLQTLRRYARNGRRVWDGRHAAPAIEATTETISASPPPRPRRGNENDLLALKVALVRDWKNPLTAEESLSAAAGQGNPQETLKS